MIFLYSDGAQGDCTYRVNQSEQWGQEYSVSSDAQEAKDKIRPARGLLGGWQRFGVDAWEEPERQWLAKAQTWRPRGQQATWEYQLQATGINFLYAGRAVPVGPGTQAVPRDAASRALWQAEPMPSSQQKWA